MGFGASAVSDVCSNSIRVLKVYKCGAASIAPTRLDFPEQPRNRKCDHPRPRLMETSRVDGVKAPRDAEVAPSVATIIPNHPAEADRIAPRKNANVVRTPSNVVCWSSTEKRAQRMPPSSTTCAARRIHGKRSETAQTRKRNHSHGSEMDTS